MWGTGVRSRIARMAMGNDTNHLEQAIRDAADERAIRHLLTRYCRAVDRMDLDDLRNVYHPDAFDDHGEYQGDVEGFITYLRTRLLDFVGTQHFLGNMHIELDGDVAHTETYCQAWHRIAGKDGGPDHDSVVGLRYLDRFERRNGEWRTAARQIVIDWRRMDAVDEASASPAGGRLSGRRDRQDAVYHFRRDEDEG